MAHYLNVELSERMDRRQSGRRRLRRCLHLDDACELTGCPEISCPLSFAVDGVESLAQVRPKPRRLSVSKGRTMGERKILTGIFSWMTWAQESPNLNNAGGGLKASAIESGFHEVIWHD